MSADEPDSPTGGRVARRALERRRGDRRRGRTGAPSPGTGPLGIERRDGERRRSPSRPSAAPAPALEIDSTRRDRADGVERRRRTLRSMLEMADERQARAAARRRDRPVMASGVAVRVLAGPFADERGRVVDADYISSRVLVRLDDVEESLWLGFAEVGGPGAPSPTR